MSKIEKINPFMLYSTEQLEKRAEEMLEKLNSMPTTTVCDVINRMEYRDSIKLLHEIIAERRLLEDD